MMMPPKLSMGGPWVPGWDFFISEADRHPGCRLVQNAKVLLRGLHYTCDALAAQEGQWVEMDVERMAVRIADEWQPVRPADPQSETPGQQVYPTAPGASVVESALDASFSSPRRGSPDQSV